MTQVTVPAATATGYWCVKWAGIPAMISDTLHIFVLIVVTAYLISSLLKCRRRRKRLKDITTRRESDNGRRINDNIA